jgi:hypothetical protein
MMTIKQLEQAYDLLREIKAEEEQLSQYRKADTFIVGLPSREFGKMPGQVTAQTRLTSADIGWAIIKGLEERIAAKKEALRKLGVTFEVEPVGVVRKVAET